MSRIITDWITREVNKEWQKHVGQVNKRETAGCREDRSYAITRTHNTCKTRFLPPEKADSPDGNYTTRSTQGPVAFSFHSALSPARRRWSSLPARPAMAASLSLLHTSTLLVARRGHTTPAAILSPRRCSFFITVYFFFPFRSLSIL